MVGRSGAAAPPAVLRRGDGERQNGAGLGNAPGRVMLSMTMVEMSA